MNRSDKQPSMQPEGNQGEGNKEADRHYREKTKEFVDSGRVDEAARRAKPQSEQEAEELRRAEAEGRSHAKEEDPLLRRGAQGGQAAPDR